MEQIDEDDGLVRIFAQLIADRDSLVDQAGNGCRRIAVAQPERGANG
jgi:hypothetical protein